MKLHKLLYFTQRECLIQKGEPMFDAQFEAWKYGPVMVQIHQHYKNDSLPELMDQEQRGCRMNIKGKKRASHIIVACTLFLSSKFLMISNRTRWCCLL